MNKAFDDFAQKEKKRERIGKIIILTIAIINYISQAMYLASEYLKIVNLEFDFKTATTIVNIVLTTLFMCGFDWVRVWFGAVMAWNAIWTTFGFFVTIRDVQWWVSVVYVLLIIYCTTAATLLFASRSVKEYLYIRKNG